MKSTATLSHAAFSAAGVLGTATIAAYLLWPNAKERPEQQGTIVVAPHWTPGDQGVAAKGGFEAPPEAKMPTALPLACGARISSRW